MEENKRYYWLKLNKNFFKRHEIVIVEQMPNGKDYILFYLKLLLESISHEGRLRFSDTIPYSESMLASITNTNIDIVRAAMKVFIQLKMIEVQDDATIYMAEVQEMIGSETRWAEIKRNQRALIGQQLDTIGQCPLEIRDKSIDIKEKSPKGDKKKPAPFTKPTVEEVRAYCQQIGKMIDCERFVDYYESKGWMIGKNHMKDWKAAVRNWTRGHMWEGTTKPTFTADEMEVEEQDIEELKKKLFGGKKA